MKRSGKLALLAALLVLVPAAVALAGSLGHRFARGQDAGNDPVASASGQAKKPHVIYAKITTSPSGMKVGAKYRTNCAKGSQAGTRGRQFAATSPVTKRLYMRFTDPDVCDVAMIAAMGGTGSITIQLYSKKP